MNYLSKKNFGVPTNLLASMAVVFGYLLFQGNISWLMVLFTVVVFLFDFDDTVRNTVKTSLKVGFFGYLIDILYSILWTVLSWFSGAKSSISGAVRTTYNVFEKMLDVLQDAIGFAFILIFAYMLFNAIRGKEAKVPNIEVK